MDESWLSFLLDPANPVLEQPSGTESSRLSSLFGSGDAGSGQVGITGVAPAASSRFFPAAALPAAALQELHLDDVVGFESDIASLFELKDWPSPARLVLEQPAWVRDALASAGGLVAPPPGFESAPTAADEALAIRGGLSRLLDPSQVAPLGERMAAIAQALVWAAAAPNAAVLSAILSCRADPNAASSAPLGGYALHFAALHGHAAAVEALISSGANPNLPDARGRTALDWAVCGGQKALLRRLVELGGRLGRGTSDGRSGLDYAAALGNTAVVAELIALRVPLDKSDSGGKVALHWASVFGRPGTVRVLLQAGSHPDSVGRDGATPLHWAVAAGHGLCVAELLNGGANPGIIDRRGQRPLDVAAAFGKRDLVEMLVDGGAPDLETALLYACKAGRASNAGHVETLKSLIKWGVDVNCRDENGRLPVELVLGLGGLQEMVAVLQGSKPNADGRVSALGSLGSPHKASLKMYNNKNSSSSSSSSSNNSGVGGAVSNSNNSNHDDGDSNVIIKTADKSDKHSHRKEKKKNGATGGGGGSGNAVGGGGGGGSGGGGGDDEDAELGNVVHIGSLPSIPGGTLWEAIKTTMSQYGTVRQVRMTPKSTFAFVEYDTVDEAVAAVKQCAGSVVVHGSTCTVSWATKRKRKGRKPKGSTGGAEAGNDGPGKKKKNVCNMFMETGACSWGNNCKYLHDASRRRSGGPGAQ